jgi:hypothetical protein
MNFHYETAINAGAAAGLENELRTAAHRFGCVAIRRYTWGPGN